MPWFEKSVGGGRKVLIEKGWGFGLKGLKNFPELIPLVGFLTFACTMGTSMILYSLYQKPDVKVRKTAELEPHERIHPEERQKLFTIQQEYHYIPELEKLRKEIGSYKC